MKQEYQIDSEIMQTLKKDTKTFCGHPLSHTLHLVITTGKCSYAVSAAYLGDEAVVKTGEDLLDAVSFYQTAVKGNLSPCAISDVWQDILVEKAEKKRKNVSKRLYNANKM